MVILGQASVGLFFSTPFFTSFSRILLLLLTVSVVLFRSAPSSFPEQRVSCVSINPLSQPDRLIDWLPHINYMTTKMGKDHV